MMTHRAPDDGARLNAWATARRLRFQPCPPEAFFRRWEPFDTLTPPAAYRNAATWELSPHEYVVVVEPWFAREGDEPLARTLFAFASHPELHGRAAARAGSHFVTRVAFFENAPPTQVMVGDDAWDALALTFARDPSEVRRALPAPLRAHLVARGFQGHVEARGRGLVLHCADLWPDAPGYESLLSRTQEVVRVALSAGS